VETMPDDTRCRCLAVHLDQAAMALSEALAQNARLIARFNVLRVRLQRSQLQLAVLGQFKRGKSTFINALLGSPLLPMAVVPLTAVPTFISWHTSATARVRFRDGRPTEALATADTDAIRKFLFQFVAEDANPENRLGVERVDLFYPAPILSGNTVLIDTPGVGSTLRHNTEAALRVLPECDAVLFVVSPDPPITEVELDYLRELKLKTARILFILNKADYVQADERIRLTEFLRNTLKQNRLWSSDSIIFHVSARDGLDGKQRGDRKATHASGLDAIEDFLSRYLAAEKPQTLIEAIARKAEDVLWDAGAEVDLRVKTLEMPLETLHAKSQAFEQALTSIEQQRQVVGDLLDGELRRLLAELRVQMDGLYQHVCNELSKVVEQELVSVSPPRWTAAAKERLAHAIETEFDAAFERFIDSFSATLNASFSARQRHSEELLNDVRKTAAEIFEIDFHSGSEDGWFEFSHDPYWVTQHVRETLIPDPTVLVDRLLPGTLRRTRLREHVIRSTNDLVLRNTSNLHWALLQSLKDAFRSASAQFEARLDNAIDATKTVIEATLERRRVRTFEVKPEIVRLDSLRAALIRHRNEIVATARAEASADRTESPKRALYAPLPLPGLLDQRS
jgi:GTP-binding protein EngB required for normal cell division